MATYTLYFTSVMSTSVEVEADDLSEAEDKAYKELPRAQICAQCGGWGQSWSIDTSDEWELDEDSYDIDGVEQRRTSSWGQP